MPNSAQQTVKPPSPSARMGLWGNKNFLLLFAAQVISLMGSGVTTVALALFAYELTGGADATVIIGNARNAADYCILNLLSASRCLRRSS